MTSHSKYYSRPEIYDIAFDFRDVPKECDVLSRVYQKLNGRPPTTFLELAAGPALHAREFARRGLTATALDASDEMVAYGGGEARRRGIDLVYEKGDMVSFDLGRSFDLVAILMDSTSYLLDNDAVLTHLDCVADHLTDGGLYLLEMGHPKDVFNMNPSVENKWEMSRDGKTVETTWGRKDDKFDPIRQITNTTVTVKVTTGEDTHEFEEIGLQRCFTANEFKALVRASGRFSIAEILGAMDDSIPFSNEKGAWRMVPILRRS